MDKDQRTKATTAAHQHMPEWIRQGLGSKDPFIRERAEETLAAIIVAALED